MIGIFLKQKLLRVMFIQISEEGILSFKKSVAIHYFFFCKYLIQVFFNHLKQQFLCGGIKKQKLIFSHKTSVYLCIDKKKLYSRWHDKNTCSHITSILRFRYHLCVSCASVQPCLYENEATCGKTYNRISTN